MTTSKLQVTFYGFVVVTSVLIALHAFGFQLRLSGDPNFHIRFDSTPVAAAMHVLSGGVVLLLGCLQFSKRLRTKHLTLHRYTGRVYLTLVLIGGIGGLLLAPSADGGLVGRIGFGMLAVLWLYSGGQAYAAIRRGEIDNHQNWMLRNFSLTFAAVTLRIYLGLLTGSGYEFAEAYSVVAWLSWVPNLILVEWYLVAQQQRNARQSATAG